MVGVGTAFGLLLLLTFVIMGLGRSIVFASRKVAERAARASEEAAEAARDKALAAVVAVGAALGREEVEEVPGLPPHESRPH